MLRQGPLRPHLQPDELGGRMSLSFLTIRNYVPFLLCILTAIPIARLYGQDKPQVAPPSKSDSFATDDSGKKTRVQHREVAGTNFQIAGVDLTADGDFRTQVTNVLGKTQTVGSGDGAYGLDEACYRSARVNDSTHLIFGQGEVDQSFILSSDGSAWKWKTPCKPSPKISRDIATASGLHLGQTQEQLIAILGLPTRRSQNVKNGRDDLEYSLEAHKRMSARELAPLLKNELKEYSKQELREWIQNHGYYDLEVYIHAKFMNDSLIYLEVSWSKQG
jgi:hypothetical protein